jgi:PAS domain S-box-containing protein
MHSSSAINTRALIISVAVFVVLVGFVLFIWNVYPVPPKFIEEAFIGMSFFSVALFTVTLFQSFKISESAQTLAKGMTQDMLVYSKDLFSELYRNSPVPYILIDENGHIESVNFATARLFHVEMDALHNLDVFTFFDGEDPDRVALMPEYFRQGRFINDMEVRMNRPDGQSRWVMLSLFSFTDANRERKGLLTLVDITKQKQVDKAKTEFVSLASHQLRTPISGMKWNIELLMSANTESFTALQRSYLEKISRGLERMDMLVNDFLSVSKFELGTLAPAYTEVAMQEFLEGVVDEHMANAEKKKIKMTVDWQGDLGVLRSDTHLLHMITSNLISNAVKYTPDGGSVRVRASHDPERFSLSVEDTGMGIPLEEQEMLFTKMFRAANARAQVTDGTGLGLYIVNEAIHVLGGKIGCVSEEGKGTTFMVTLPV